MGCHLSRCCCELTAVCSANNPSSEATSSAICFSIFSFYFAASFYSPPLSRLLVNGGGAEPTPVLQRGPCGKRRRMPPTRA